MKFCANAVFCFFWHGVAVDELEKSAFKGKGKVRFFFFNLLNYLTAAFDMFFKSTPLTEVMSEISHKGSQRILNLCSIFCVDVSYYTKTFISPVECLSASI